MNKLLALTAGIETATGVALIVGPSLSNLANNEGVTFKPVRSLHRDDLAASP